VPARQQSAARVGSVLARLRRGARAYQVVIFNEPQ
jgi:hypothetical protein